MLKLVLLLSLIATVPAFADDITDPPSFDLMGSVGNNSALSMACHGDPPFQEIECNFTQVLVSADSTEDVAKRREASAKELSKMGQKDIDKVKNELSAISQEKIENRMKGATPEQQAYTQDLTLILKALSSSKDKASFVKAMTDHENVGAATCSITVNTFEQHFTRISKNKWLHNPGPVGLCNVVRISTLENSAEYPNLWTFTQSTVTADQDPTCQKWVKIGDTIMNRWDSPKALKFGQCKYIQFGY